VVQLGEDLQILGVVPGGLEHHVVCTQSGEERVQLPHPAGLHPLPAVVAEAQVHRWRAGRRVQHPVDRFCRELRILRAPRTYPSAAGANSNSPEKGVIVFAKARFANTLADDPEAQEVVDLVAASRAPRWWPWILRSLPTTLTANQSLTDQQFMSYVALGRAVGRRAVQRLDTPTAIADRPAIDAPAATG
jgi:hypothetical protein